MGFFDDITDFVKEVNAMGNELSDIRHGVVKEVKGDAVEIKQTLQKTVEDIATTTSNLETTVKESLTLSPQPAVTEEPDQPKESSPN
jgi:hypothetical protein